MRNTGDPKRPAGTSASVLYLDHRARQLEGTDPAALSHNPWLISHQRVFRGWGIPKDGDWGLDPGEQQWPQWEPPDIDGKAKPHRIHHYQRVRTAAEARQVLQLGVSLEACFQITDQWLTAQQGLVQPPGEGAAKLDSHSVFLIKYHPKFDRFVFWNTWGEQWGHNGYGSLTADCFDACLVEAWAKLGCGMFPDYFQGEGVGTVVWMSEDILGGRLHCREVFDATNDERIAWSFAVLRDGFLEVEELFVKPGYRRRGHGRHLARLMRALAESEGLTLRLWIPFADCVPHNLAGVVKVASDVELEVSLSGVRWAGYRLAAHEEPSRIYLPTREPSSVGELPPISDMPQAPRLFRNPTVGAPASSSPEELLKLRRQSLANYQRGVDIVLGDEFK